MDFERKFIMDGLREAIGHLPDYKIRFTAITWRDKGVLLEEDLAEIQVRLDAKNGVHENVVEAVADEA